jgi:HK97 family phage major capsid protein
MTQPAGPGPISLAGLIPPAFSAQIISEATEQSAALALGTRVPMSTKVSTMPVPKTFPRAAWVSTGGRKPYTDLSLDIATMTAEEVAAVVSIPDEYLEDSAINLWGYAQPLLSEAIAIAVDDAMIWGEDAPASFPAGGVAGAAVVVPGAAGDPVASINNAMSAVELQGVRATGNAADNSVLGMLRGVRDGSGALLLGPAQVASADVNSIFGLPTRYSMFPADADGNFITGAWRYLVIGVRQDIRFRFSQEGVIADESGSIKVSAFQDNQTLLKVWARFACAIVKPVTARGERGGKGPADPWAITDVTPTAGASGDTGTTGTATPTKSTTATKSTGTTTASA